MAQTVHRVVVIDTVRISDWATFHDVVAAALGFPPFYGRNMDASIDCMTALDEAGSGMTAVTVPPGGLVVLDLDGAKSSPRNVRSSTPPSSSALRS